MEPHQSCDTMTAHLNPTSLQILVNPWTPVPAARGLITGTNVREEPLILLRAYPERTTAPGVITTAGDREHATQDLHRIGRLLCLDEAIPHPDSLAKKATAFFKMSRSMRSSSRRKIFSSSVARKL